MKKKSTKIWVVFHCEIWATKPNILIDEMGFHVASSLAKAEAYIKDVYILDDAWWKIAEFTLDNPNFDEDSNSSLYYGNKGKLLKKIDSRINKAVKIFEQENPKGYKT